MVIGLIREGKIPADSRVALTPAQCKWMLKNRKDIQMIVQTSEHRCFSDKEYQMAGVTVQEDLSPCDILLGIKEVPVSMLMEGKTYLFFSHTKKKQPYNQLLLQTIVEKKITLIDYECLEHEDGTRIIGFGFFAGIVGAHNGMLIYGNRTREYHLERVNASKNFQHLIHTYFGLKLPNIKIAVTGSGRVAHGVLEIMNLLGIHEAEPDQYLKREFAYPVYVHLKGSNLYTHKETRSYDRNDFHEHPDEYICLFKQYLPQTDILMNGVYWEARIPRLFELADMQLPNFRIQSIADITDDIFGSVPCNLGDTGSDNFVYGVDKQSFTKTAPYLSSSVDIMAVGNLPNELPRDASRYFGEQLIKHVFTELFEPTTELVYKATIVSCGDLTPQFSYLKNYAKGIPEEGPVIPKL